MPERSLPITQSDNYYLSAVPALAAQIQALSVRAGIPLLNQANQGFCLHLLEDGLFELYALSNPALRIRADFCSGEFRYRIKTSGKNQPLSKAIGVAKGLTQVLDATGGLGGDAMVLASIGCQVSVCERQPLIALLLENALQYAAQTFEFAARVQLQKTDALTYLAELQQRPQVIYLDPMYPSKEKSALPRKAMRLLESLVGRDDDQRELFNLALDKASARVVVKRPKAAPPLAKPTHSFGGTTTRYDMYLITSQAQFNHEIHKIHES